MQPPLCLPSHSIPRPSRIRLPRGSVDCHCHVFKDPARYALRTDRSYTPSFEPFSKYLPMCEVTGIERTVQVNSAIYGYDNSVTLDVIWVPDPDTRERILVANPARLYGFPQVP